MTNDKSRWTMSEQRYELKMERATKTTRPRVHSSRSAGELGANRRRFGTTFGILRLGWAGIDAKHGPNFWVEYYMQGTESNRETKEGL